VQDELAADLTRDDDERLELLDDTRIHPEDYDLPRVLAMSAQALDEEDLDGPSAAIAQLRETNFDGLHEMDLTAYAAQYLAETGVRKDLTLRTIALELEHPYADRRAEFAQPDQNFIFTMLTGETPQTLETGFIIPVRVLRVRPDNSILVKLESGIEGYVPEGQRNDPHVEAPKPQSGSTIRALVLALKPETFEVELSTRPSAIAAGDSTARGVRPDDYFEHNLAREEKDGRAALKVKSTGQRRRLIKHPDYRNMSSAEAELYLSNQSRGDCVIRPSSKENHLAVTWKVDTGVYQHIGSFFLFLTSCLTSTMLI
jgi:transcription elongation factor SPT6